MWGKLCKSLKGSKHEESMEPLTTGLGLVVGKAVFKAWFKDNEFLSSATESSLDLLRTTVADRRARSAAERQIARISELASDTLETFIDFEWGDLMVSQDVV